MENEMFFKVAFAFGAVLFLSGCISVKYNGSSFAPNPAKVKVYTDKTQITSEYTVMGTAVASGQYKFSYEEMREKLAAKAQSEGADAVLIEAYRIVPEDDCREDQILATGTTTTHGWDTNSSEYIQQAHDKFKRDYGQIGKNSQSSEAATYKRIIKAAFLKYKDPAFSGPETQGKK